MLISCLADFRRILSELKAKYGNIEQAPLTNQCIDNKSGNFARECHFCITFILLCGKNNEQFSSLTVSKSRIKREVSYTKTNTYFYKLQVVLNLQLIVSTFPFNYVSDMLVLIPFLLIHHIYSLYKHQFYQLRYHLLYCLAQT